MMLIFFRPLYLALEFRQIFLNLKVEEPQSVFNFKVNKKL